MNIERIKKYIADNKLASINGKRPRKDTKRNYERKYLYALLRHNGYSSWAIAEFFGLKSHGSVLVGLREYENLKENKVFVSETEIVRKTFPIFNNYKIESHSESIALIELENQIHVL